MKRAQSSYGRGISLLMISALISKLIGAFYRIPLTNILGAEGMGVYQLVFPIYIILITVSSSGIPTAISRLISERLAQGEYAEAQGVFKTALVVVAILSVMMMILLTMVAPLIAGLQGNSSAMLGYRAIAPAVVFTGFLAVIRGYFQARFNMFPTAISGLVEQGAKLVFGLLFAILLLPQGIEYGVAGALLGVSLSELIALIFITIMYSRNREKVDTVKNSNNLVYNLYQLLRTSLPITIGGLIMPFTQLIDSVLVVNIMKVGISESSATSLYGLFTGPVSSLINLPVALILAIAIAVVPAVSKSKAEGNAEAFRNKSVLSLNVGYVIGIGAMALFLGLGLPIVEVLYPALAREHQIITVGLLAVSSISVVLLAGIALYTAFLQGLGMADIPVRNLIIASFIKLIGDIVLIKLIGIYGSAIATVLCYLTAYILNMYVFHSKLMKSIDPTKNLNLIKNISRITLAGAIIFLLLMGVTQFASGIIAIMIGAVVGCIYFVLIILFGVFTKEEIQKLPFSRRRKESKE